MKNKFFWPVATALLTFIFLWTFHSPIGPDLTFGDDIDGEILVQGLERTITWSQVQSWFTGTWVAGENYPFYRPITSLVWYLQWQCFGASRHSEAVMISFVAAHWLSHFVVCLTAVGFLRRLVGGKIALVAIVIWASSVLAKIGLPIPAPALFHWKDSPDMWVSISILLSLWALLSYVRTGERRFVFWAFVSQLIAIGFKEMSYVLPFMAAAMVWFEHKKTQPEQRRGWAVVGGMFGVVLIAYAMRFVFLSGGGFRFGTNGSWLDRFAMNVAGGRVSNSVLQGDFAPISLALIIVGMVLFVARKQFKTSALGLSVVGIVGLSVGGQETVYRLLMPLFGTHWRSGTALHEAAATGALLILSVLWAIDRRDPRMLFAWLWVLTAYLPMLTAPLTDHALYLPSMGWAIWVGIVLAAAMDYLISKMQIGILCAGTGAKNTHIAQLD